MEREREKSRRRTRRARAARARATRTPAGEDYEGLVASHGPARVFTAREREAIDYALEHPGQIVRVT